MRRRRWTIGLVVGLSCFAIGAFLRSATMLSAGVIGLSFAAYGSLTGAPGGIVQIERDLSDPTVTIGDTVEVTVTVTNVGEQPMPELRVVDVPPPKLPVVDGSLAHATSLESGESESFTYELEARRGRHAFGDTSVLVRNVSGSVEREETFDPGTQLSCSTLPAELPPAAATMPYDGNVETDSPGEGITFHSIRQFHPSDPLSRIDWKRYARTNELSTIEYQSTRAASLVVVVDARSQNRVARSPGETDAVSLSVHAAIKLAEELLSSGNRVGAARYGTEDFLAPATGHAHAASIARFLAGDVIGWSTGSDGNPLTVDSGGDGQSSLLADAGVVGGEFSSDASAGIASAARDAADTQARATNGDGSDGGGTDGDGSGVESRADGGGEPRSERRGEPESERGGGPRTDGGESPITYSWSLERLLKRLATDAQVVFCSPMLDREAQTVVKVLQAHGHAVTLVSPDVTTTETVAGKLATVRRNERLRSVLETARVVDWGPDEQLATAVDRAARRWRR